MKFKVNHHINRKREFLGKNVDVSYKAGEGLREQWLSDLLNTKSWNLRKGRPLMFWVFSLKKAQTTSKWLLAGFAPEEQVSCEQANARSENGSALLC